MTSRRIAEERALIWRHVRKVLLFLAVIAVLVLLAYAPSLFAQYPSEQLSLPYVVHSAPYFTYLTLTNLTADRVSISYTFIRANASDNDPSVPLPQYRADVLRLNPRESKTVKIGEIGIIGQGELHIDACKEFMPCGNIIDPASDPLNPRVLQNFNPSAIRRISATAHIYMKNLVGGTRGDSMTARPWYALPGLDGAPGMDRVQIVGIRSDGHYATQIGLANMSMYSTTVLTAVLRDGMGHERGRWIETLGPLLSVRRSVEEMFGADAFAANRLNRTPPLTSAWVEVRQEAAMPNEIAARTVGCESGCPRFDVWASVTDSWSGDFSLVESSFETVNQSSEVAAARTVDAHQAQHLFQTASTAGVAESDTLRGRLRGTVNIGAGMRNPSATSEVFLPTCSVVGPKKNGYYEVFIRKGDQMVPWVDDVPSGQAKVMAMTCRSGSVGK